MIFLERKAFSNLKMLRLKIKGRIKTFLSDTDVSELCSRLIIEPSVHDSRPKLNYFRHFSSQRKVLMFLIFCYTNWVDIFCR